VRQEIARAAWLLFAERGYEDTTVAEIARAAGLSRRSFFRYFSSKEDVVIGTSDALAEDVLAAFARRPRPSRRSSRSSARYGPRSRRGWPTPPSRARSSSLLRESRTLRRALLERHARLEERLALLIAVRTGADLRRDPTPALLAFLARALMDTAFNVWYDQRPRNVGAMIEDLFRRLRSVVSAERGRPAARSEVGAQPPHRR
jgi:AcrR family transcriptional regulator